MKTLQDLQSFYNATLLSELRVLEEERKGIVREIAINFIVTWGLLGLCLQFC